MTPLAGLGVFWLAVLWRIGLGQATRIPTTGSLVCTFTAWVLMNNLLTVAQFFRT